VRTEKVSHASALPFQLRFGSDCSFTYSFGKDELAWQRDSEIFSTDYGTRSRGWG
jgi:hypothetical protein